MNQAITNPTTLYEAAMKYLDVPFRHRGRTPNGLDCVGLLVLAARDLGYIAQDKKVYGREPFNDGLREMLVNNNCVPVTRPLQIDDIVLMKHRTQDPEPSHVGIITPHPYGLGIIHAYAAIGKVALHRLDALRKSQVVEVFQWHQPS